MAASPRARSREVPRFSSFSKIPSELRGTILKLRRSASADDHDQGTRVAHFLESVHRAQIKNAHVYMLLFLSFIVLPGSSVAVFRTFDCKRLDDDTVPCR